MTREEKLSVFNAALTGLLASGHFTDNETDPNGGCADSYLAVCEARLVLDEAIEYEERFPELFGV